MLKFLDEAVTINHAVKFLQNITNLDVLNRIASKSDDI